MIFPFKSVATLGVNKVACSITPSGSLAEGGVTTVEIGRFPGAGDVVKITGGPWKARPNAFVRTYDAEYVVEPRNPARYKPIEAYFELHFFAGVVVTTPS